MPARITPAEAKRLGVEVPATARRRSTKKVAPGPYHSRCTTCQEEFDSYADEDRHLVKTHHARYSVLN